MFQVTVALAFIAPTQRIRLAAFRPFITASSAFLTRLRRVESPGSHFQHSVIGRISVARKLILVLITIASAVTAANAAAQNAPAVVALPSGTTSAGAPREAMRLPLVFVPSVGGVSTQARFVAYGRGATISFFPGRVALAVPSIEGVSRLRLEFEGANPAALIGGAGLSSGAFSYLQGRDPKAWRAGVGAYSGVRYRQMYPGIDLIYDGSEGLLKGTYRVEPGADASRIRWRFAGARVQLSEGALHIGLNDAAVLLSERAPIAWQEMHGKRVPVPVSYRVHEDGTIGFVLGHYDAGAPLWIDPTLEISSYLGGAGLESANGVAVDAQGNVYVTGYTSSEVFVGEVAGRAGGEDAFVTKLTPDLSRIVYSVLLGGAQSDRGMRIAVDGQGSAYVAGLTRSDDFPLVQPLQARRKGGAEIFVVKLDAQGQRLLYSTYLGGTKDDQVHALAVASDGSLSLGGDSESADFPTSSSVQAKLQADSRDGFVSRLGADGSALLFSTYIGGSGADSVQGLALDAAGDVYVTGETDSADFPLLNGLPAALHGGGGDAFVVKLSATGQSRYGTLLGGSGLDAGRAIALDIQGNVYVLGATSSSDLPLVNALQNEHGGSAPNVDAFVAMLSGDGARLVFSTYYGGAGDEAPRAIALEQQGGIWFGGSTGSTDLPLRQALQGTLSGSQDTFVAHLTPRGEQLRFASYLGGGELEVLHDLVVRGDARVVVVGETKSSDMRLSGAAVQNTAGGAGDGFIAQIALGSSANAQTQSGLTGAAVQAQGEAEPEAQAVEQAAQQFGPGVHVRSIGAVSKPLYWGDSASVGAGERTVMFGPQVSLHERVGAGDALVLNPAQASEQVLYVAQRVDERQVILQRGAAVAMVNAPFEIRRAFISLQDWEDARGGDLVADQRVEVGMVYADGVLKAQSSPLLSISGSKTNAQFFFWLQAAPQARHTGVAGSGAVLDGQSVIGTGIEVQNHYTRVEGLELKGFGTPDGGTAIVVSAALEVQLESLLIHGLHSVKPVNGIVARGLASLSLRNSVLYDGTGAGIDLIDTGVRAQVDNCTVYGMGGRGVFEDRGQLDVHNTMAVGNVQGDFAVSRGARSNNVSSDQSARGSGSLRGAQALKQFVSLDPGREDLHLRYGALGVDAGLDRSAQFALDVDGEQRPFGVRWDIGADERRPGAVRISESEADTVVAEGGTQDSYTVVLATRPQGEVVVSAQPDAQVQVQPSQLVFTPQNWNQPQTVLVRAVDDILVEGRHVGRVGHAVTSSTDPEYNAMIAPTLRVNVLDNEAGVLISESGGRTEVQEGGANDTYQLLLSSAPNAEVSIAVQPESGLRVQPDTLTFDPSNWEQPQTLTVSATNNARANGTRSLSIAHEVDTNDVRYAGTSAPSLSVLVLDDEAGIVLEHTDGATEVREGGISDTYWVSLSIQPSAQVKVAITTDAQIKVSAKSLTFTTSNWNSAQKITVSAVRDTKPEGSKVSRIQHVAVSKDLRYDTQLAELRVIVVDNVERAVIDRNGGVLTFGGGVKLEFAPGTVSGPTDIIYEELLEHSGDEPQPFRAFSVTALARANGQVVSEFTQPVKLTVPYSAESCASLPLAECEKFLTLFTRQEGRQWYSLLTTVDRARQQLTASLTHLSQIGAAAANDTPLKPPADLQMPSVSGFTSSEFNGDAAIEIPIQLPPLAGGFPLKLSLNYSTGTVNSIRNNAEAKGHALWDYKTQASVYGLGWELSGLPSIAPGPNGPLSKIIAAPFLNVGGSHMIYYDFQAQSGQRRWETQPLSFNRITNNGPTNCDWGTPDWRCINELYWGLGDRGSYDRAFAVQDHHGIRYNFFAPNNVPDPLQRKVHELRYRECGRQEQPWIALSYHVTRIDDANGNHADITYLVEDAGDGKCRTEVRHLGENHHYDRAVTPKLIEFYPQGATLPSVKVEFVLGREALPPQSRPEGTIMEQDNYRNVEKVGQPLYSKNHVTSIKVKVRDDQSSSNWAVYRQYDLEHGVVKMLVNKDEPSDAELPLDQRDFGHMLLKAVKVRGPERAAQGQPGDLLPSYFFVYNTDKARGVEHDWNHARIVEAENGYGGLVRYEYAEQSLTCSGFDSSNVKLGRYVVKSLKSYDGIAPHAVTDPPASQVEFEYQEPHCRVDRTEPNEKKSAIPWFLGFGKVTKRLREGDGRLVNTMDSHYLTTQPIANLGEMPEAGAGLATQVSVFAPSGVLMQQNQTQWEVKRRVIVIPTGALNMPLGLDWLRKQSESEVLDGKTKATDYVYANTASYPFGFGYPDSVLNRGDVPNTHDDVRTDTQYTTHAPNAPRHFLGYPIAQQVYGYGDPDGDGSATIDQRLRNTQFYYDGAVPGQAQGPLTRGLLTLQVANNIGHTPALAETSFFYDSAGNLSGERDPNGHTSSAVFDPFRRAYPITRTNALGQPMHFGYNFAQGVLISETDANSQQTRYDYTSRGWLQNITRPDSYQANEGYHYRAGGAPGPCCPDPVDAQGKVAAPFVFGGAFWDQGPIDVPYPPFEPGQGISRGDSYYDGLGRVIQTQIRGEFDTVVVTNRAYNAQGQVILSSHAYELPSLYGEYKAPPQWPDSTRFEYDALGRLIKTTAPDQSVTTIQYRGSALGWEKIITNPNQQRRTEIYDGQGRMVRVEEEQGAAASYEYNALGELLSVTDAHNNVTRMSYDLLGRKIRMLDPDMGQWQYAYDAGGNMLQQTDARGLVTTLTYDALNRLKNKSYSDGSPRVTYYYDVAANGLPVTNGKGRRTEMEDAAGRVTWSYNGRGLVEKETRKFLGPYAAFQNPRSTDGSYTTQFQYDHRGLTRRVIYPDGEAVTSWTDNRGLLAELKSSLGETLADMKYDLLSRPDTLTLGNGLITQHSYYPLSQQGQGGRLQQLRVGAALLDSSYVYDPVGNITRIVDNATSAGGQTSAFVYDRLNRLTSASASGGTLVPFTRTFAYDAIGNITNRNGDNYEYARTGNAGPHAVTRVGSDTYGYEPNGNMGSRKEDVTTYIQKWNAENRLSEVTWRKNGMHTVSFVYDGDGRRLIKQESPLGGDVATVYLRGYEETFRNARSQQVTKYYHLDNRRVAVRQDRRLLYLHGDHLNSTSATTDQFGKLIAERRYYPYGEERFSKGDPQPDFGFTDQRNEASFGLMDYNARFYDPRLGKFISPDTVVQQNSHTQAYNRYAYVFNNPVCNTDPSGNVCPQCCTHCNTETDISTWPDQMKAVAALFGPLVGFTYDKDKNAMMGPTVEQWSASALPMPVAITAPVVGATTTLSLSARGALARAAHYGDEAAQKLLIDDFIARHPEMAEEAIKTLRNPSTESLFRQLRGHDKILANMIHGGTDAGRAIFASTRIAMRAAGKLIMRMEGAGDDLFELSARLLNVTDDRAGLIYMRAQYKEDLWHALSVLRQNFPEQIELIDKINTILQH